MKKLIAAAIVSGALLFSGCTGGNGTVTGQANLTGFNGNPGGSTPPTQKAASTALFQPAAGLLPYPTDLYFFGSTDGTLNIQPPNPLMPNQAAVNALDGFSTTAVIRENFAGALNPASFTATSVIIVPVTTDNTTKATTGVLGAPLTLGTDFSAALATDAGVGPTILEITPLHPLMPSTCINTVTHQFLGANCKTGTGYLVFLTNGITDASGNPAVPDTDYATIKAALASGGPTCPSITDKTLNGICQLTGAHLQIAQALHINVASIVLSFSFTTESTADTLELLAATATAQTIKVNPTGITTAQANPLLKGHANLYVGALSIPYYLSKAAPLTGSWTAPPFPLDPSSTFVTRFNPLPVATQMLQIAVLVTVPNASSTFGATTAARRLAGADLPARHHAKPRGHARGGRFVCGCRLRRGSDRPAAARHHDSLQRRKSRDLSLCEQRESLLRGPRTRGERLDRAHLRPRADHSGDHRSVRLAFHQPDEPSHLARQPSRGRRRTSSPSRSRCRT